ncbi:MAG: response regulator [Verrucomicrobia bacterium]|nr:response regulator [Verrucomicrobiota bacterium]
MTAPKSPNPKSVVLLVDDVPDNLRVVGNILQEDQVEIAVAASGAEALDFVNEDPPDLILLDVMMPDMDGFEVCRRLKKNVVSATIPVIFLTARTETEDIVAGFEAGGVDYVAKPFRPAELRARVRTHLHLHQLKRFLSICSYCNRIREATDRWERVDTYLLKRTGTRFSHGICPDCLRLHAAEWGLDEGEIGI